MTVNTPVYSPAWVPTEAGFVGGDKEFEKLLLFRESVENVSMARRDFFNRFFDPRRNVEDEAGLPRLEDQISVENLRILFERDGIARRVVEVLPKESWQVQPKVYESASSDDVTPFEEDWDNLSQSLNQGSSWFQDEAGSIVWEYLMRADIRSGIGHFGVILLGIDDEKNYMDPVDGVVTVNEGYLTPEEEHVLLNPPSREYKDFAGEKQVVKGVPLNNFEKMCLNRMVDQRIQTLNRLATNAGHPNAFDAERSSGVQMNPTEPSSPAKTSVGKQVTGTEDQYPGSLGLGMPASQIGSASTALSGTDQQYFGVQFGASEAFKDTPAAGKRKLLFMRVFDESLVQIVRYEWNANNPRFGQPVMYRITLNDPREMHTGVGLPLATIFVHWSRVVHLADNLGSSEVFGAPRQRAVLNNLLGLHKIYAGAPEAYWKNCVPGVVLSTHPQMGGDVKVNRPDLRDQVENFQNSMQKFLILTGMGATTIMPSIVDPTASVAVQLEAICICLGIPVRVFKGSERGELASSQDDASWNDRLRHRQNFYVTPRIICRTIDRLIQIGVLRAPKKGGKPTTNLRTIRVRYTMLVRNVGEKDQAIVGPIKREELKKSAPGALRGQSAPTAEPATREDKPVSDDTTEVTIEKDETNTVLEATNGYSIEWPDLDSLTDKDKAAVLLQRTQAYAAYVSGGLNQMIPEKEYMTKFDSMEEEEAESILADAEKAQLEKEKEDAALAEEHGMLPVPPDGFQHPPLPPVIAGPGGKPGAPGGGKPGGAPFGGAPKPGQPQPGAPKPPQPAEPGKPPFVKNEEDETPEELAAEVTEFLRPYLTV